MWHADIQMVDPVSRPCSTNRANLEACERNPVCLKQARQQRANPIRTFSINTNETFSAKRLKRLNRRRILEELPHDAAASATQVSDIVAHHTNDTDAQLVTVISAPIGEVVTSSLVHFLVFRVVG